MGNRSKGKIKLRRDCYLESNNLCVNLFLMRRTEDTNPYDIGEVADARQEGDVRNGKVKPSRQPINPYDLDAVGRERRIREILRRIKRE